MADDATRTVLTGNFQEEMQTSYMEYAMSVIISRALPEVRDGLKPVQRRILYAMHRAGATSGSRTKHFAACVGDVLKLYHPHSDTAVYDALVRMAQPFSLRYPLIEGQGNFGSVDGDPPAAMRYTEAKLSAITGELMADIEKQTVDMGPNYDGSEEEPSVLPARVPNLLVNGASGIAVGMTTNIPPHNLREVTAGVKHLVDNPEATAEDLLTLIKGPDFPTGGIVMGTTGIKAAYSTGHGRIIVRARHSLEQAPNGRERIIVYELPYAVNKAALVAKIAELVSERKLEGIADLRDESDRNGMRVVIELKREAQVFTVLNNLYKHTTLQTTFGVIMLAIVDGRPVVLSLKQALQLFIDHRRNVILRRTRYDLERAQERAHILEGLKICLDHLDEVIKTIRAASDQDVASTQLQSKFGLSERQAKAVLALTLGRLTRPERSKVDEEYEQVIKTIAYRESILASDQKVRLLIKEEMDDVVKKYGDERRTEITDQEATELPAEDLVPKEEVVVTLTHRRYVKRQPLRVCRAQKRGGVGLKGAKPTAGSDAPSGTREEDYALHLLTTHTHASMLFFTQSGRVFQLRVHEVPERERQAKGMPINNLIDIGSNERITSVFVRPETESEAHYMLMVTKNGYIKKTAMAEYANVRGYGKRTPLSEYPMHHRAGQGVFTLKVTDRVGKLAAVRVVSDPEEEILVISATGMVLRTPVGAISQIGRQTQGVIVMRLAPDDQVVAIAPVAGSG